MQSLSDLRSELEKMGLKYFSSNNENETIIAFDSDYDDFEVLLKIDTSLVCLHFLIPDVYIFDKLLKKDRLIVNDYLSFLNSGRTLYGSFGLLKSNKKTYRIIYSFSVSLENRSIAGDELLDYLSYIIAVYEKFYNGFESVLNRKFDFDIATDGSEN